MRHAGGGGGGGDKPNSKELMEGLCTCVGPLRAFSCLGERERGLVGWVGFWGGGDGVGFN